MSDTQTIKDRLDVVQLIGEYIQLKKAGANWKANCPFHQEKSPSFMVHPEKQIWHCFGCSKGGDIFTFIQEIEGLDFPEALKLLADKAGVKIDGFRSEIDKSQKNRILEINNKAAYFFHHFLLEMPTARKARDYLENRGLNKATIEEWQIGYVPDQWELLTKYLLKKGFSIDDILLSGLTIKKDGADVKTGRGFYDRFRGRIMFPIWDVHNNVVGFTGRILVESENSGGKYVNTPQTLVYDKSRVLYGLNKAKQEIKNKDLVVLVEGQMDVIACHQATMKNVVAVSGTALTIEQIKLLKRYTNNIAMAFDADAAGQNAVKRGIDLALEQGMNVKIIQIPAGLGKDADECVRNNSAVWFKAVENSQEIMFWYFANNLTAIDKKTPREKQGAVETVLGEIIRLPFAVERDHWLKKLTEVTKIDLKILQEELRRLTNINKNRRSSVSNQENNSPQTLIKTNRQQILLENLWSLFFKFPGILSANITSLRLEYFVGSPLLKLYELAIEQYNNKDKVVIEDLVNSLSPEDKILADVLVLKAEHEFLDFTPVMAEKELNVVVSELNQLWVKQRRQELTEELKLAQERGDKAEVEMVVREIVELGR